MIGYRIGYRSSGYSGVYISQAGSYEYKVVVSTSEEMLDKVLRTIVVVILQLVIYQVKFLCQPLITMCSLVNRLVDMQLVHSSTFIGELAGKGGTTSAPYSSGGTNTAVGNEAFLYSFTTGYNNVAMGYRALYAATTG